MISNIELEKPTIIVTKDNFLNSLEEFKDKLNHKSLEYIIINNEISTTNKNIIEKEGEIVFSEFTICYTLNYRKKYITFLIPTIKYHRYSEDEIASFNSDFLNYLINEKNEYNLNNIYNSNSLSYENINKREKLKNNLESILKDGKPFNEENKKSYNFFPKAIEIPSKAFQQRFESILKSFVKKIFEIKDKNENNKNKDKKDEINLNLNIYETNYKLLNRLLNFRWNLIFENLDNDIIKFYVDGFKISFLSKRNRLKEDFIKFVEKLVESLNDNEKDANIIKLLIGDKYMNEEFFKNWKQYLQSEDEGLDLKYTFYENKKSYNCKLILEKTKLEKNNCENITKFLKFILSINKEYEKEKEYVLDNIFYKKFNFNMKYLFTKKAQKYLNFEYHISLKISSTNELNKIKYKKEEHLSQISYKNLLIHNKNDEEILFKYKITPYFKDLFETKNNNNKEENENGEIKNEILINKIIEVQFSNDLPMFIKNREFNKELNKYISILGLAVINDKYSSINYRLNKKPDSNNEEFKNYFEKLVNLAKEVKKNNLLDEEIGLSYFYKLLFDKKDINIYCINLKNKIYFAVRKLLLDEYKDNEEEINNILNNVNIYDMSFICKKKNINYYKEYLDLKNEENTKNLTLTQKLACIIKENESLTNFEELKEYKNKFFIDEKEKIENKLYINIDKNKFNKKAGKMIKCLKDKTDFTINKNNDDNKTFKINFIDAEKFNLINNISKEINNIK